MNAPRKDTVLQETGVWIFVLGIPFLVLFLLLMKEVKNYFKRKDYLLVLSGMMIFLSGALGIEALSNFFPTEFMFVPIIFEEYLEMLGVTMIFWGFHSLADVDWKSVFLDEME